MKTISAYNVYKENNSNKEDPIERLMREVNDITEGENVVLEKSYVYYELCKKKRF